MMLPALFQNLLTLHVVLGISATAAFGYAWMQFRDPDYKIANVKILSALGTLALFSSWITGGYYYLYYYGAIVKPKILAGSQPWGHKLMMEAKEHIFLIIPIIAIATLLSIFLLHDKFQTDPQIKKSVSALLALATILGALMMVMGFIISSAH